METKRTLQWTLLGLAFMILSFSACRKSQPGCTDICDTKRVSGPLSDPDVNWTTDDYK